MAWTGVLFTGWMVTTTPCNGTGLGKSGLVQFAVLRDEGQAKCTVKEPEF